MRITITLDDRLVRQARSSLGPLGLSALVRAALTALIERESARRLARLGGGDPRAMAPDRRRPTCQRQGHRRRGIAPAE